jgi:large subunit ribosomal protein L1
MAKLSKRMQRAHGLVDQEKQYSMSEALAIIENYGKVASAKFDESVEVVLQFNLDTRQSDQMLRGAVPMPHGLGRNVKVVVLTSAEKLAAAKASGADLCGDVELIEDIKDGRVPLDFDVCIATPEIMPQLSKIGKILGPKGLMPNPKLGTVTDDVAAAVKSAKAGRAEYRTDKAGIVHAAVGKVSFIGQQLQENIKCLYSALLAAKPSGAKGSYVKGFYLSTSMGVSIRVDLDKIDV